MKWVLLMAEAQGSMIYQFLRRLLSQLGPREASAEVIKADEGTRTITGEEDIAQFRAIIKRMMDEALRDAPSADRPQAPEQERSTENLSQKEKEDRQNEDDAWEEVDRMYEEEHGYHPNETRYWHAELQKEVQRLRGQGDSPMPDPNDLPEEAEVGRLHEQRRILEQLMKRYQPKNPLQDQSYQSLIDFWDQTMQEHKRAFDTYKTRYPERYDREQTSTRGEIDTPLEPGWIQKEGRYEYQGQR